MTQTFTDNCFSGNQVAQTSMQYIENNCVTLKSSFAGASAPSNLVAGQVWYDTANDYLKIRNAANNAWRYLDLPSGTVVLFGQATSPTGWTKKTTWTDNAMLCINTQADGTALASGGSANPQAAHTHTGPSHTHTGPSHSHTLTLTKAVYSAGVAGTACVTNVTMAASGTGATSAGGTGATGSNTIPSYQEIIACTKD